MTSDFFFFFEFVIASLKAKEGGFLVGLTSMFSRRFTRLVRVNLTYSVQLNFRNVEFRVWVLYLSIHCCIVWFGRGCFARA